MQKFLIGVGEEVIITRPGVFGPESKEIGNIVFDSIKYRKNGSYSGRFNIDGVDGYGL